MSSRKTVLMMTNTGDAFNEYGKPIKAGAYLGYTDGLHTVQVIYNNFTGGFGIQGTLSTNPKEDDWFWIHLTDTRGNCSCEPFMTYPKNELSPTGHSGMRLSSINNIGDTGTEAFTFVGNFVYLRSVLTRDYINPPPKQSIDKKWHLGQIDKVMLSI